MYYINLKYHALEVKLYTSHNDASAGDFKKLI